jgi:hypothetical protein
MPSVNGVEDRLAADESALEQVRWEVVPEWQETLLGPQGLRLYEWLQRGQAQIVKKGTRRTVYRVDLPERTIFLKHYRCPDVMDLGRHLLRASASRREFRKAVELARRSVPTIRPIGLGEVHCSGIVRDNYLITEGIPHAVSLNTFVEHRLPQLSAGDQRHLRRKLAVALARLCAAAHQAGVFHDDFHGGNVLVRLDTCSADSRDIEPALYLVDLPGIRFSGPLPWTATRRSLIMLNSDWGGRASITERMRFWRTYRLERGGWNPGDERRAVGEIARATRDYACNIQRGRAKRSLQTNRDYYALETASARGHAVAEVAPADLVRLLDEPERWAHAAGESSHGDVGNAGISELPLGATRIPVVCQPITPWPWWRTIVGPTGRNRALWWWYAGHSLLDRGVSTPRPLAVCVPRRKLSGAVSYLVSQRIEGAIDLVSYLGQLAQGEREERARRSFQGAASLGRMLGRMHAWRTTHVGLSARHILVRPREASLDVWLRELDGIRFRRRLTYAEQVENLASLARSLSSADCLAKPNCLRFLEAYLAELRPREIELRVLWRDVLAARGDGP